ncbi:MAG: glycosyltransferase [Bacteroidota bacterium]|nr:glycosyltransferase [Bacteroidota bacterium]
MNSIWFYILFGAVALSLLMRAFFALIVFLRAGKSKKTKPIHPEFPPVSVIIAARNEAENLKRFLPQVLSQDYSDFEVIVVDDCSLDDSRETLYEMQKEHDNLTVSWVPNNAVQRRGKKLALSIGIKAAKNEWLLFTDADCSPASKNWIQSMAAHMHENNDFVLGYGGYRHEKSVLNSLIRFDTLKIAMRYGGYAGLGHVYMGVGRNLAYRKSLWVENRGFAGFFQMASGDDDLFVNAYAKSKRTAVCFSADGKTESISAYSFSDWKDQKSRHMSTSRYYAAHLRFLLLIEPINQVLSPLLVALTAFLFWSSIYIYALLSVWLIVKLLEWVVCRSKALLLNEIRLSGKSVFLDVILPLNYIIFALSGNKKSKRKEWK